MPAPTTTTAAAVTATAMPLMLRRHLTGWAGALPVADELLVVASARNAQPGWAGRPQLLTGIADPAGRTVVAVPPAAAAELLARHQPARGVRSLALVWVDTASPRLPGWLRPFGGQALVAFDEHGDYLAGVGIKRHDELGHEISVGTEPQARGRGLARRLVAQAARHILDQGRIPTYLHTFDNLASSRVAAAAAAGFCDHGWSALMLSDEPATLAAASTADADRAA